MGFLILCALFPLGVYDLIEDAQPPPIIEPAGWAITFLIATGLACAVFVSSLGSSMLKRAYYGAVTFFVTAGLLLFAFGLLLAAMAGI